MPESYRLPNGLAAALDMYGVSVLGNAAPPIECTGQTATWCPVHGVCYCDPAEGLDDPRCELHAPNSPHGEHASR